MKLFLWSDGFGGLHGYTMPFHAGDEALGDFAISMVLLAICALLLYLANRMGAVLNVPFLCLIAAALIMALVGNFFDTAGSVLLVQPLVLYAWACYCWGTYGVTVAGDEGHIGMLGWLISGIIVLVICCGMASELSVAVMLVPTMLQIGIWWTALMAQGKGGLTPAETGLRIMFRIAWICAAVGLVIVIVMLAKALKGRNGTATKKKRTLWSIIGNTIMTCYGVGMVCFLGYTANLSYLAPVKVFESFFNEFQKFSLVRLIGGAAEGFLQWFSDLLSTFFGWIVNLIFRIFETSGPEVHVRPTIAGLIFGILLIIVLNVITLVMRKAKKGAA